MSYLLDTNVVSEWHKPRPDAGLIRWTHEVDEDRTYLSVITIGELRKGMDRMAPGRRRSRWQEWLHDELPVRFEHRILPVDIETGHAWGRITARAQEVGRSIDAVDGLIAATAEVHGLEVVTRNTTHFEPAGVAVHNPWEG